MIEVSARLDDRRRLSRTEERKGFTTPARLTLLEGDLDSNDSELTAVNEKLARILWAMIGILISTSTASILLALNLGFHK